MQGLIPFFTHGPLIFWMYSVFGSKARPLLRLRDEKLEVSRWTVVRRRAHPIHNLSLTANHEGADIGVRHVASGIKFCSAA
jgi:hypothetical protein